LINLCYPGHLFPKGCELGLLLGSTFEDDLKGFVEYLNQVFPG
jgi:hypothetical protein